MSRWADVAIIMVAMKELGIEKRCPDSSWIEMERKVYLFTASDKSHPASEEIYSFFVREVYNGQLFIKLKKGFNLPAMDPWLSYSFSALLVFLFAVIKTSYLSIGSIWL
ncbi:hypothetical protein WN943_029310 [Citrus x changshan-huyou]